ncbi:MAG: AAA family ATPase [Clostridia bacterium]|nr:AAA family ATPase [Clostridia bacterium]
MKILSAYIAGFGKFVNQAFDFQSDLTVIKEDNGWGKTTLADFIRCMLYGQDAGRGKAVESNDRAKYAPWNGGAYGGSLTFLYQNKKYRVERSFGKTPAYDSARVFDGNNMQCFEFGDRAELLGEKLFGVDADGYRRSVYIPQGEIQVQGVPDDIKNRLLSLLNSGGAGDNGGAQAMERLDAAERALRAKRKPSKGKLDVIDERLAELERAKGQCDLDGAQAKALLRQIAETDKEIAACSEKLEKLNKAIEQVSRQGELALKKQTYEEAKRSLEKTKDELTALNEFFAGITPTTVNLDGIEGAVSQYYELKTELSRISGKIAVLETDYKQYQALKTQKEACEKILDSYDELLEKNRRKKGAGTNRKPRGEKIIPPKRKSNTWIFLLSLAVGVGGALLTQKSMKAGLALFVLGVLGMIFVFFRVLPRYAKIPKQPKPVDVTADPAFSARYDEVYAELDSVQEKIAALPSDLEESYLRLTKEKGDMEQKALALEKGILVFFQNFRFGEIYDYRAATAALREKIARHGECEKQRQAAEKKLTENGGEEFVATENPAVDMQTLKAEKANTEEARQALTEQRAKAVAEAQRLQQSGDKERILAEEGALTEEKVRLEKKYRAIVAAKAFLARAKENLAGRYLDPVEKGCRAYLAFFESGAADKSLRFAADGVPVYEDKGAFRSMAYYSEGTRELVGLCTRFALADAVFQTETPTLILDDPFVNLDDKKTENAKRLVKELCKKYQIVYLTCKEERKI